MISRTIEKIWEEFDHDFYHMAEEIDALRDRIEELEKEIRDHVCTP